jgi:predicted nucleic-acid-binding protein
LRTRQLLFADVGQVRSALERYAAGDGDLADWLIWERSRAAGAERVLTFDGRLLRSLEFVELTP